MERSRIRKLRREGLRMFEEEFNDWLESKESNLTDYGHPGNIFKKFRKREVTKEEMEESEKQTKKIIKKFPEEIGDIILIVPISMN